MKVITEGSLRHVLKMHFGFNDVNQSICSHLINELQELDTLTVSKLRPMSEVPRNGKFLVVLNSEDDFHECSFLADGRIKIGTVAIRYEYCIGWIPKPIYKPEEMICPDACG